MVKSTDAGDSDAFNKQDGLFTLCVRGIEEEKTIEENIINASISRVLSAKKEWNEILKCAANLEMQIVISNTTEVGLVLTDDNIHQSPPSSFPGKLLAFLYERYKIFNGDETRGMVIIPTELIPNNADKLLSILIELCKQNNLEKEFMGWLSNANHFCNSLVDRIVPGRLSNEEQNKMEAMLGCKDELMIMSEVYRLWAIESSSEKVKGILSFSKSDNGVVIAPDITVFRELKLRLLNGSHTLSCGLAFLAGFVTVKEAMSDKSFSTFIKNLMIEELAPAIAEHNITIDQAKEFSEKVLDRFRNPFIAHQWISITMQYSSKMYMRNIATLKKYVNRFNKIPQHIALGFAGYLLFTKPVHFADNKYYGEMNGTKYFINDDSASYFFDVWKANDIDAVLVEVLSNQKIWKEDLNLITGFANDVKKYLNLLINEGAKKTLSTHN